MREKGYLKKHQFVVVKEERKGKQIKYLVVIKRRKKKKKKQNSYRGKENVHIRDINLGDLQRQEKCG